MEVESRQMDRYRYRDHDQIRDQDAPGHSRMREDGCDVGRDCDER